MPGSRQLPLSRDLAACTMGSFKQLTLSLFFFFYLNNVNILHKQILCGIRWHYLHRAGAELKQWSSLVVGIALAELCFCKEV